MAKGDLTGARVFMLAFACEPARGSEPGVGAAFLMALCDLQRSEGLQAVLVTRPHKLTLLRSEIARTGAEVDVVPVAIPQLLVRFTRRRRVRFAYLLWQFLAVRHIRALIRVSPDINTVVHHVTFATEGLPTWFGTLRSVHRSTVLGPAGTTGGQSGRVASMMRDYVSRLNLLRADVRIATNIEVSQRWRELGFSSEVEPNIVVEQMSPLPIRWDAIVVSLLIPRKRINYALHAFARSSATGRMAIIGDGGEESKLRELARVLGISSQVDFMGKLSRPEVLRELRSARVLLHPSSREGSTWVVGEAQASGAYPVVFAGSGADGAVRLAGVGSIVRSVDEMAAVLTRELLNNEPRVASARWSKQRLPTLLRRWYLMALNQATTRG